LAAGVVVGAVLGFVFALRAGAVIGPVTTLVLWRGVGPRALALSAAAILGVVVPVLYLAFPAKDRGGFNFSYATDQMGAHWCAVAALVLLGLALARTLAARRRVSRATPPTPAGAPARATSPSARP
jgi:hypothetical protein